MAPRNWILTLSAVSMASLSTVTTALAGTPSAFEARQLAPWAQQDEERIVGVGLALEDVDGRLVIQQIVPDSPAARDGFLQPSDVILAVQTDAGAAWQAAETLGLRQAVRLIRGPEDQVVGLRVARGGGAVTEEVFLARALLTLPRPSAPAATGQP